ncbi:TPA: hypothetical protein ACTY2N_003254 [Klebsiella michiganensis]|uniref:hypothetical protein n=1 Tax=Klebsiella michiganensis TaxID=1134687 RepID=UPI0011E66989|nr:hypothetical protein [Klebsiella michiganensis]ELT9687392.1 hypothetical protein [Klebsiella michiganensis]MBZ7620483.1 hypothetical protein [Klebsiella michiganensis]HBK4622500.1 hypothetical protein [Klebsiella michiganensis]HBK4651428.1 hypothetical protein [Klebsiella michiganensis]HBM3017951.1 hypothetical protein [Klebsiella michiganensis]
MGYFSGGDAAHLSGLPDLQTSCKPVVRARRVKRRPREKSAEWDNFPEAMLRICSGYRTCNELETRSPGKAR